MTTRVCKRCGTEHSIVDYHVVSGCKGGRRPVCRYCIRKHQTENYANDRERRQRKQREWNAANPRAVRECNLRKKYGMGVKEYEIMFGMQGGRCLVCGEPETVCDGRGKLKRLAVDHNHDTGEIRGLLCQKCNQALGLLGENPVIIRNLANYIV